RGGVTGFVGRTAELEQLRGALDRASLGHGQVVAVVGEPGVGKSRLFWELLRSHRVHGWLIVQSASVSYGKATAYLPVIELLRGYFEIESRDDPRKIREKVTGKVLTLAPALAPVVPALLALLDVPVDEASWHALDPLLRRQQTLDAVKRLLLRESEAQPLVVTAALVGERGAYRLTRPVENLKIPATEQAILAARIDRLAPEAKRLLQAAAVIGKDVPMPLLLAIADTPEPEVRAELTHLQAAEFLYETRLSPDLEYTFKHALTHEVAYQGLLHDRQRALHARITEAIEQLAP